MGFFSWECKGCHESIKAPYDLPQELKWQNDYVALGPGNLFECGSYDGYGEHGRLPDNVELWHTWCWEEQGKPKAYTGASAPADDQGYFYERKDDGVDTLLEEANKSEEEVDRQDEGWYNPSDERIYGDW